MRDFAASSASQPLAAGDEDPDDAFAAARGEGFSVEAFERRAAGRLIGLDAPILTFPLRRGDQVLNPEITEFGRLALRDAAVLIPVVARGDTASVVLTLRTPHLARHAGQIAFPGGKIDPEDDGPVAAALREAHEEIGLDPAAVQPIGFVDPYLAGTGFRVFPVVGLVDPAAAVSPNLAEVAEIFEVPLSHLMADANFARESRAVGDRHHHFYALRYEARYIWGITAGILRSLFERVYG